MSRRIDKSWLVFTSIENVDHDRCVDLFSRPDGTFGFEEFRRDFEDCGEWTPIAHHAGSVFATADDAYAAAARAVPWLAELPRNASLLRRLGR